MKRLPSILCLAALLLTTGPAHAQSDALADDPGYVDVTALTEGFDAPPNIEVNVRGALLDMVVSASRESNPDLADLLAGLKAIQVRGFTENGPAPERVRDRMEQLGRDLEKRGWQPVVRVREDDEHVSMFFQERNGAIDGLTVLVAEPDETMFINIVGTIHPEEIGKLGRTLDIDPLKNLAQADTSGNR